MCLSERLLSSFSWLSLNKVYSSFTEESSLSAEWRTTRRSCTSLFKTKTKKHKINLNRLFVTCIFTKQTNKFDRYPSHNQQKQAEETILSVKCWTTNWEVPRNTGISIFFLFLTHGLWYIVLVTKLCPTLCDPMDCSLPGSSVHGIFQARVLEWVAISFSRASSWPRDRTCIACIGRWTLYHWATKEAWILIYSYPQKKLISDPHV